VRERSGIVALRTDELTGGALQASRTTAEPGGAHELDACRLLSQRVTLPACRWAHSWEAHLWY